MSGSRGWARALTDGCKPMRRGAWYRVVDENDALVTVEVYNSTLAVNRDLVDLRDGAPTEWSVVRLAVDAPAPADPTDELGLRYAVCPGCRARAPLTDGLTTIECNMCGIAAGIDWSSSC